MASIARRFVAVAGRAVHLRIAGSGPPLLMLHQSPKSGRELIALMARWAGDFTCIAPDSPGYGLSDPLPGDTHTIADYAAAMIGVLDTLGLDRVLVYGVHTGAKIALSLGAHHPDRIAGLVANGVFINSPAERQELAARYLPPFDIHDDGRHLMRLWARMIDQRTFFPWYERRHSMRLPIPLGSADELHDNALDFLAAGDAYRHGYAAALRVDAAALIARQQSPTWITGGPADILSAGLQAITPPPGVRVGVVASDAELEQQAYRFLQRHAPEGPVRLDLSTPVSASRPIPTVLPLADGHAVGLSGGHGARHLLILPKPGGMVATQHPLIDELIPHYRLTALDPPGHGWSDGTGTVDEIIATLQPDAIIAPGYSGLMISDPPACPIIAADCAPPTPKSAERLAADATPDLTPELSGAHLARAWMAAKLDRLYFPASDIQPAAMINADGGLSPRSLHDDALALLLGYEARRRCYAALPQRRAWFSSSRLTILAPRWAAGHAGVDHGIATAPDDILTILGRRL